MADEEWLLRGCIGTFGAVPLAAGLASFALKAALEDARFPPITAAELPALRCGVSLLVDFEDIANPHDWVVRMRLFWLLICTLGPKRLTGRPRALQF